MFVRRRELLTESVEGYYDHSAMIVNVFVLLKWWCLYDVNCGSCFHLL